MKTFLKCFVCTIFVFLLVLSCCRTASAYINTYPIFRAWDTNNNPLVGGLLWSYMVGTSTPAPTYSDPACTIPNSNPVVLDSQGQASVYFSGTVKLVQEAAPPSGYIHGTVQWTINEASGGLLWLFSPQTAGVLYSSTVYGGSQGALENAITAVNGSNATLYLAPANWLITSNLSIPANITLKPERGAVLAIATGVTLTINGTLDAGLYQIFSYTGTGKVVFGSANAPPVVYAEWWGALGDGANDDGPAINAAAASVRYVVEHPRISTLLLPAHSYYTTVPLDLTSISVDCKGIISSAVTNTYLTKVGSDSTYSGTNLDIHLSVVKSTSPLSWDAGSIGILVDGLFNSRAWLEAKNCETGVKILSSDTTLPTWNNDFTIGSLYQNKTGLLITQSGTGWVNLNRYYGGEFNCTTAGAAAAVKILRGGAGLNKIDTQVFYGPDFEYTSGVNGIIFDDCANCVAHDVRIEGSDNEVVAQFNGYCQNNKMRILGYDTSRWHKVDFTTGACNGYGNAVEYQNDFKVKLNPLSSTEFAYITDTHGVHVPGFEFFRVNAALTEAGYLSTTSSVGLKPRSNSRQAKVDWPIGFGGFALGLKVKFAAQVKPLQRLELISTLDSGSEPAYYLRCFDSTGTELSGTAPYYVQGQGVHSSGTYYYMYGNGVVYFDKTVQTVYVGTGAGRGIKDFTINGFQVPSDANGCLVSAAVGYPMPLEKPGTYYSFGSPTRWPLGPGVIVNNQGAASGQPSAYIQIRTDRNNKLTVAAVAGDTTITVTSASYMTSGDLLYVLKDDGEYFWTTINGAPVGNVVTMTDAIPTGKSAAIGNAVINEKWLPLTNIP